MFTSTALRDWSDPELEAVASLVVGIPIWAFLAMRMTDGGVPVDVPFGHLLWTYVAVVVAMAVAHAAIATTIALRRAAQQRATAPELDEREAGIELRAGRVEGWVGLAGLNVLVLQAIAASGGARWTPLGPTLTSTSELVFALLSLAFLAHLAKQVATLWLHRR